MSKTIVYPTEVELRQTALARAIALVPFLPESTLDDLPTAVTKAADQFLIFLKPKNSES